MIDDLKKIFQKELDEMLGAKTPSAPKDNSKNEQPKETR